MLDRIQAERDYRASLANLTDRERAFVAAYMKHKKVRVAALEAGCSEASAGARGSQMKARPSVARAIDLGLLWLQAQTEIDAQTVVDLWADVIRANMGDFFEYRNVKLCVDTGKVIAQAGWYMREGLKPTLQQMAAIQSIEEGPHGTRIKFYDKLKAADGLAKHLGMFTEKVEVSGPGGQAIPTRVVLEFDDVGCGFPEPGAASHD